MIEKVYCKTDYFIDEFTIFKKGKIYEVNMVYDDYKGFDYGYDVFYDIDSMYFEHKEFCQYFETIPERRKRIIEES